MNLKLKTHNEYLNINFDNATDENINKSLLKKRITKIVLAGILICFILSIISLIIKLTFISIITLIGFSVFIYLSLFICISKDIDSIVIGIKNSEYWDKIIALKKVIQEIDMNKEVYFQSDFTELVYLKKNSSIYSEYKLPLSEIKYSESDNFDLTYDKNTLNIILYVPIKYIY
jgi:hypothetical protein